MTLFGTSEHVRLPPRVATEVRRILDREARRLLAEGFDRDTLDAAAGANDSVLHDSADQGTPALGAEVVPVKRAADGQPGALAA